jgi:uncharacterized protein (TIGR03437 family)
MALLSALLVATLPAQSIPFDAQVVGVAVDPANASRIYASTVGGLLKTDNRGFNWEQLPIFPLGSRQPLLREIEFDRANPSTIYAWASGQTSNRLVGAWRSSNRGVNWQRIIQPGSFPENSELLRFLVAPANASVLYAVIEIGNSQSTYRSADGGTTWARAGTGGALSVSTGSADTLYRAVGGNVFRSTDGARSWLQIGQTYNVTNNLNGINAIAASPGDPNLLLASMSGPSSSLNGIFRSTTGGTAWTRVLQTNSVGVRFSSRNPSLALAGDCCGLSAYFTNDGGQTFTTVSQNLEGSTSRVGLTLSRTSFDNSQTGQLINALGAIPGGGIAVQANPNATWRKLPGTYTPTAVPNITLDSGQLLSGDSSEARSTVQIVAAEGGSAAGFRIANPTATSPGTTVRILQNGSDPANPTPSLLVTRSARNLQPGSYNNSIILPVSGALNRELNIEGTLEVVDQPQSAGVSFGNALPPGVFDTPYSLATANGKIYVGSFRRLLALDGKGGFQVIAGTASSGFSGDGGPATAAQVSFIRSVAVAPDGTIYFHDSSNRRIRRIAPNGTISTFAGNPSGTTTITEGAALNAINFSINLGLAVRSNGELLVAHSNRIWRVEGGVFRSVAGGGFNTPIDGTTANAANLSGVDNVLLDAQGSIVFATSSKLFRLRPNNTLQHLAGASIGEEQPGSLDSRLNLVTIDAIALGPDGIYLADRDTRSILRVKADSTIDRVALNGMIGAASNCTGAAYAPSTSTTQALAFAPDSSLLVAQSDLLRFWIPPSSTAPAPLVVPEGIVNAASLSRALSPGALASIFGSAVASTQAAAPALPLPAELGGGIVCVAGEVAPIAFASPSQLNVQLPFALEPGTHTLRAFNSSGGSAGVPINLQAASPEIFRASGRPVVIHPNGSLNSPENGIAPGEAVVIYLTGIGNVTTPLATGAASPSSPLAGPTLPTSATVGGTPATLLFLGMTPGFVGLAQANLIIPDLPPGDHALVLSVGSFSSEALLLSVK